MAQVKICRTIGGTQLKEGCTCTEQEVLDACGPDCCLEALQARGLIECCEEQKRPRARRDKPQPAPPAQTTTEPDKTED